MHGEQGMLTLRSADAHAEGGSEHLEEDSLDGHLDVLPQPAIDNSKRTPADLGLHRHRRPLVCRMQHAAQLLLDRLGILLLVDVKHLERRLLVDARLHAVGTSDRLLLSSLRLRADGMAPSIAGHCESTLWLSPCHQGGSLISLFVACCVQKQIQQIMNTGPAAHQGWPRHCREAAARTPQQVH
jgi:hypothetical protein